VDDKHTPRELLPEKGIWSVESLARYLGLPSSRVMQVLSDNGVKVIGFSSRYKHKLFRLEDLESS
jgi:RNase P/RNase MRP subunit p30